MTNPNTDGIAKARAELAAAAERAKRKEQNRTWGTTTTPAATEPDNEHDEDNW